MNTPYNTKDVEIDTTINIRAELEKYLRHWKWFALGIIISLVIAFLYLRYTTPQYSATAVILIKDDKRSGGGASAELAAFEDLGILGGSSQNIHNEIEIIKSRRIIGDVIKNLNLNIAYFSKGAIKETEIYNKTPFILSFPHKIKNIYKLDTIFSISQKNANNFDLISQSGEIAGNYNFGEDINSAIGMFRILNRGFDRRDEQKTNNRTIKIVIKPLSKLINSYKNSIDVSQVSKNSSVVNLSIQNTVKLKAKQILDSLVSSYNKDAIRDKNLVSQKTKIFIDDRLKLVKKDFDNINLELKDFKTTNRVTNIESESELVLQSINDVRNKIIEANIQLTLISFLYDELLDSSKGDNLLPSNLGLEDANIAASISEYNKLIQKKTRLSRLATIKNPQIVNINTQLKALKSSLIKSLENSKNVLELTLNQFYQEDIKIKSKISGVPVQELELGKIKLKQEITSELYAYLLKKKEETDISLAVTVANAKIIDTAYSSGLPVSPKRKIVLLASLLLGAIIPFIIIYLINLFDTKIHNRVDVEKNISVPFLGDIPKSYLKGKIAIGRDERSSIAEAFRLIRTNLDFMLTGIKSSSKTIFITSTTSGEGKSFISINVAASLALSGKKVLLLGMDLRAPKVTKYLGIPDKKGVTNYITDDSLNINDLIFNIDEIKDLDIISSGVIPPNPAELLMTDRTEELFGIVKENYDYIVVDTAPVNLVTDTLLISKHADIFLYVARANYLDKRLLVIPQDLYDQKRLPNMAMILNDTDPKRSYGYGTYGYGYLTEQKPWYKKVFNNK